MATIYIDSEGVMTGIALDGETDITLPEYVKEIGEFVFTEDIELESLQLDVNCKVIRNKAFFFNQTIQTIIIPDGSLLRTIEPYAFAGSNPVSAFEGESSSYRASEEGLLYNKSSDPTAPKKVVMGANKTSISFEDGTTEIGERAFSFCDKITSISIPSSVTSIGRYAFSDCVGLTEITIPSTLKTVSYGAFYGCYNVSMVNISREVEALEGLCFGGMSGLRVVQFPNTVDTIDAIIGEDPFCGSGRKIVFSLVDDIESYDEKVLELLPGRMEWEPVLIRCHVGDYTYSTSVPYGSEFADVLQAAKEAAEESVAGTTIDGWYYDSTLKKEVYPTDIVETDYGLIDLYAKYSVNVDNIYTYSLVPDTDDEIVLTGVSNWDAIYSDGSVVEIPSVLRAYDTNNPGTVTGEYKVVAIGDNLFAGADKLTGLIFPNGLKRIGKRSFSNCNNLASIAFKEESGKSPSLSSIGIRAFEGCGLTELRCPDSLRAIRQGAFLDCKNLSSVSFGKKLSEIGTEDGSNRGAFAGCDNLETVRIDTMAHWLSVDFGFSTCNPLSNGARLYVGDDFAPIDALNSSNLSRTRRETTETKIVDGVEKEVTSYVEVDTTEIKPFSFVGCGGLTTVNLTNTNIETIGEESFSACGELDSVVLGNGKLDEIGRAAFSGLESLKSITIPGTITKVGEFSFNGCTALGSDNGTIVLESGITEISSSMFSNCTGLASVTIPVTVEKIGSSAFSGCTALTSVTFVNPDEHHCVEIGDYAFYACGLVTIGGTGNEAMPQWLETIGERAFAKNIHLTSAILPDGCVTVKPNVFANCPNIQPVVGAGGYGYIGNWIFADRVTE